MSEFDESDGNEKISLEVDKLYQMKIIKISPEERKIGLSIRALKSDDYEPNLDVATDGTGGATLGDHFRSQ